MFSHFKHVNAHAKAHTREPTKSLTMTGQTWSSTDDRSSFTKIIPLDLSYLLSNLNQPHGSFRYGILICPSIDPIQDAAAADASPRLGTTTMSPFLPRTNNPWRRSLSFWLRFSFAATENQACVFQVKPAAFFQKVKQRNFSAQTCRNFSRHIHFSYKVNPSASP